MKGKVYFKEDQTFVGTWMWYLVIVMMVFAMLGASIPLLLKSATESIVGMTIVALLSFGLLFLMHQSRLYVSIDPKGLYYRFPPFVSQIQVDFAKIQELAKDEGKVIAILGDSYLGTQMAYWMAHTWSITEMERRKRKATFPSTCAVVNG